MRTLQEALRKAVPWWAHTGLNCLSKTRFSNAATAERAAQRVTNLIGFKLRVYRCQVCSRFHLTKKLLSK